MCGRFSLGVSMEQLVTEFGPLRETAGHEPRFNIAPTQAVSAVVRDGGELRLGHLRWGLVPAWAKDPSVGARMINARSETAHRKPSFREALQRRRCWILADGFYEWRREQDGSRTPFHFRRVDGRPFAFAGLWERWRDPEGLDLVTCTILTRAPVAPVAEVHDRMPVILSRGTRDVWLDPAASPKAVAEVLSGPAPALEGLPVSTRVNSPANDPPNVRAPLFR